MDGYIKKGTLKRLAGEIKVNSLDYSINGIIKGALLKMGYDLFSKPLFDDTRNIIGEEITVYKEEPINE